MNAVTWSNGYADTEVNQKPGFVISGELVKAMALAYSQFEQELSKKEKEATNDFARSMSKLESYEAKIFIKDRQYIIRFNPKDRNVRGGEISYFIKKDDYSLYDTEYSK